MEKPSECISQPKKHVKEEEEEEDTLECDISHTKFSYKDNSTRHIQEHTAKKAFKCEIKAIFPSKKNLIEHDGACNKVFKTKLFECKICHKKFATNQNLKVHQNLHTGEKPFTCEICNKTFKVMRYLNEHKKLHNKQLHTDTKPFECVNCNKKFIASKPLKNQEKLHTSLKVFYCESCPKRFFFKSNLNRHYNNLSHTGEIREKTYDCHCCDEKYPNRKSLVRHIHSHNAEKTFDCGVCGKKFPVPFHCVICQRKFSSKHKLIAHNILHNSEKSYKCNVCRKELSSTSNLRKHIQTMHTTEETLEETLGELHKCDDCSKQFLSKNILKRYNMLMHFSREKIERDLVHKEFTTKKSFFRHDLHTEEKSLECDIPYEKCSSAEGSVLQNESHKVKSEFDSVVVKQEYKIELEYNYLQLDEPELVEIKQE